MLRQELYNHGARRWVFFGRDPKKPDSLIDTNQYLVTHEGRGLLPDPGGMEIFPAFVSALTKEIALENIEALFASHQDPDIISSLSLWIDLCGDVKTYASWLWGGFIPHFGGGKPVLPIPDEGMAIPLAGSSDLTAIPAHYLHSSGNFSLYDPTARILFSGDVGAALLPPGSDIFVQNMDEHVRFMEGFHRRWMPSNAAKQKWIEHVRKLDVELMCPQHGAIFRREQTRQFLDWFERLEVGSAVA